MLNITEYSEMSQPQITKLYNYCHLSMTLCTLTHDSWCFAVNCCLHLQERRWRQKITMLISTAVLT